SACAWLTQARSRIMHHGRDGMGVSWRRYVRIRPRDCLRKRGMSQARALIDLELRDLQSILTAEGGTRTHTSLLTPDFESGASADSATSAQRAIHRVLQPAAVSIPKAKACGT